MEDIAFPDDVQETAEELLSKQPSSTRYPGVYIIYDGKSTEPLYVGEAKNVYQRLFDHHMRLQSGSKTVREHVESDPELDRSTENGEMWEWTEWAWIAVSGSRTKRQQVERLVELKVDPRYPSR